MVNHRFLVFSIQTPRRQNPTNPTKRTSRFLDGMSARRSNLMQFVIHLLYLINCYQLLSIVCHWARPVKSLRLADKLTRTKLSWCWLPDGSLAAWRCQKNFFCMGMAIMKHHEVSYLKHQKVFHILIYLIWSQPPKIIGNRSTNSTFHQTFWGVFSVSPSWSTSYGRWAMAAGQIVPSLGAPQDADAK